MLYYLLIGHITPLIGNMKKKKTKPVKKSIPVGRVLTELVIWDFSQDDVVIRHYAEQVARALELSYNLSNFGVKSFGLEEE
jgi:hypothetical protein